jgi:TrmH family RNA methyltransferase
VAIQPADVAELYRLHRVLVLDGVQDPGNVGTILRTAAWFGLDAVLGGTGTADFYNPKVVRASMGGLWDVPVARSEALGEDLKTFKSNGFELVGADLDGLTLDQWQPESTGVLVLGNEANGISPEVRLLIDRYVTISGRGKRGGTESLNVATAAGILMHRWMAF